MVCLALSYLPGHGADVYREFASEEDAIVCLRAVYVYAMGQEPWLKYLTSIQYTDESRPIVESNKLVADCQNKGIESDRLYCQKEIILNSQPAASRVAAAF